MSRCGGLHCPGCGDGGGWIVVAGVVVAGVVVYAARHFIELVVRYTALALLGAAGLAVAVAVIVWMARRGAGVAIVSRPEIDWAPQELPAPEPRRAVAAPQELHIHLHGSEAEQAQQIAQIRQAGYRAWDQ